MGRLSGKRVVLVVAHHGYRDEELEAPRAALAAEGAEVVVVSSSLAPALGMRGGRCDPDRLYSAVKARDLDALVFVGGLGASEYFDDLTAHRLAQDALREGKLVGAICVAVSVLAEAGLLDGLTVAGHASRAAHLAARGARWTDEPVRANGPIVTARGPEDADAFARALVAALAGR
jgi:protease I